MVTDRSTPGLTIQTSHVPVMAGVASSSQSTSVPVSASALSDAVRVHVPAADSPLNAARLPTGAAVPLYHGEVPAQWSSSPKLDASSKVTSILLSEHPYVLAGTPGRSSSTTSVPAGLRSLRYTSPT